MCAAALILGLSSLSSAALSILKLCARPPFRAFATLFSVLSSLRLVVQRLVRRVRVHLASRRIAVDPFMAISAVDAVGPLPTRIFLLHRLEPFPTFLVPTSVHVQQPIVEIRAIVRIDRSLFFAERELRAFPTRYLILTEGKALLADSAVYDVRIIQTSNVRSAERRVLRHIKIDQPGLSLGLVRLEVGIVDRVRIDG